MNDQTTLIKLCLVCLESDKNYIAILSETGINLKIDSILLQHFGFECSDEPKSICTECWNVIDEFNKFYQKIIQIHENYIKLIPDIKSESDEIIEINPINYNEPPNSTDDIPVPENEQVFIVENLSIGYEEQLKIKAEECEVSDSEIDNLNDNDYQDNESNSSNYIPSETNTSQRQAKKRKVRKEIENRPKRKYTKRDLNQPINPNSKSLKLRRKIDPTGIQEEDEHVRTHVNMKCDICGFGNFEDLIDCRAHYKEHHNMEGYLTCCNIKYSVRRQLVSHVETHVYPDGVICPICNKKCSSKVNLRRHHDKLHKEKKYKCDQCPKSFSQANILRQHMIIHNKKSNEIVYNCDACNKSYNTEHYLKIHIRNVHEKAFTRICDVCGKEFCHKGAYDKHKRIFHSEKKLPKAQCQECGAWLKHEMALYSHINLHHKKNNDKKYICDICGKESPNNPALYTHKKKVHFMDKNFKCHMCDSAFKYEKTLKEHIARHMGDILYTCKYCPKTSNSESTLRSHRKKYHPVEHENERLKSILANIQGTESDGK